MNRFTVPILIACLPLSCSSGSKGTDAGTATGGSAGGAAGRGSAGAGAGDGAAGVSGSLGGSGAVASGAASVLMHHNDLARDGVYVDAKLTHTAVASLRVDPTFSGALVTANVYAQPLYLAGRGAVPDQVIVATEGNQVYAFDATTGAQTWRRSVGTPVSAGLPCGIIAAGNYLDGTPNTLGITGTPVIDAATRTLYLDAMTADSAATAKHFVHALDADTGAEQAGWPAGGVDVNATASSGGTTFSSLLQNQRAALALVGGKVFVPYGGHGGDCLGYHGWVVGISTSTVAAGSGTPAVSAWATRAVAGGIWGASGIASDGTSIFVATGNSKSSASAGANSSSGDSGGSWGDSETVYKFPTSLTPPPLTTTTDYFVPSNWVSLDDQDADVGGTGPVLLDLPGAPPLAVALGKDANAYLLNRSNLGGMDATPLAKMQVSSGSIINAAVAYTTATATYVVFRGAGSGCPAGQSGGLTAVKVSPGATASSAPTMSIAWCGGPSTSGSPAVSQDPTGANTIVWSVGDDNKLHGIDGDLGQTVWFGGGPTAMSPVQPIQTPIIANGRVFVASNSQVYAFTTAP
jgi:outer membrane protein assembly factor BamB